MGDEKGDEKGVEETSQYSLPLHLVPWMAVPLSEVFLTRNLIFSHEWWQILLEGGLYFLFGVLQWRFVKEPWVRSPMWAFLVPIIATMFRFAPFETAYWTIFFALGVVLLANTVMKDIGPKLQNPLLCALFSLTAMPLARVGELIWVVGGANEHAKNLESDTAFSLIKEEWFGPQANHKEVVRRPPVVVISIDTLRADLGSQMRSFDFLASRGRSFPSAMASSSWTMTSVASIQTGVEAEKHGASCHYGCQGIDPNVKTVAEDLSEAGYLTAAVVANPWLSRPMGFARGFDSFLMMSGPQVFFFSFAGPPLIEHPQNDQVVADQALKWLDEAPEQGFYLWVHFMGPHMPYSLSDNERMMNMRTLRHSGAVEEEFAEKVFSAYGDQVDFVDAQVMRILNELERRGHFEKGYVILTSDHGEEFWEHNNVEHGHSHHSEVVEVPLTLAGLEIPFEAEKQTDTVSVADVASTVRAMVGLSSQGHDLRKTAPADRVVTAWGNLYVHTQSSARDANRRVIITEGIRGNPDRFEAFDLTVDPMERNVLPRIVGHPVDEAALSIQAPKKREDAAMDEAALKALGYLED